MPQRSEEKPVGIFDSGVGGLTVVKEIAGRLPDEHILYVGDTARVPYGVRSPETVLRYSLQNADFLASRGIKVLVVACNTSSAVSLDVLRERMPFPVVGVVEPGARAAARVTEKKSVAVIGTETTIQSRSYEHAIRAIDAAIAVRGIACPLFVPLIEEGWLSGEIVRLVVEKYLSSLKQSSIDTIVLGCTHYPMLKEMISDITKITLIDSAVETAKEVRSILEQDGLLNSRNGSARIEYFVTDAPDKFIRTGEGFLGSRITNISKISLDG